MTSDLTKLFSWLLPSQEFLFSNFSFSFSFQQKRCVVCNLTLGRTSGSGCHPHTVFLSFFLEDKTSAPDVFSSCSFIPRTLVLSQVQWWSVAMVTGYDAISSRWSNQFGWKYMFFQLLSTIKVNLVAKIMQSAYLCVIFHVKHKKLPFLAVLTWFLLLGKIQDGGQDGDHCWWRHRPPAAPPPLKYTSSC